ncbi:MAG: ATP-binding protein [Actinobacteria bacterium]|nr:ATP-binding protein [Actinomycetota bacterium]
MDLVERESDLGALADLLDALVDGRSRAVLIEGPAGIGKSRLLAALRDGGAARGMSSPSAWSASCSNRRLPRSVARPPSPAPPGPPARSSRARPARAPPSPSSTASTG